MFQVTGNIQTGMTYETKSGKKPEESHTYRGKTLIESVSRANYARIDPACRTIPPPAKQFDGPKRLNPSEPL